MNKRTVFALTMAVFLVAPFAVRAQTAPPTAPTDISASITQSGQVYVSWDPSTSNLTIGGYYLYRDGRLIANTPGLLFYTDDAPAGSHTYAVSAYDSEGNTSQQSLPSSIITIVQDTAPTAPTGLTLVPSSSSVELSWNGATDNIAVVGYYIYRNGQQLILPNAVVGTNYTDTGLAPGYTYNYQVGAYNAQGYITRSPSMSVTTIFDVTPPTPPSNLIAKGVSSSEIDLSWRPATDNIAVTGYAIYQDSQFIGDSDGTSTTYQDTDLSPDTLYSYQVVAIDEVGNMSQDSVPAAAMTQPQDLTPPSIPANLHYVSPSTSEIDLSWNPSTDNVGVAGYYIYQNGDEIGSTQSTTYASTYLTTSTTYLYAVRAYDVAGNISPQQSIGATTLATNPVTPPVTTPSVTTPPVVTPPVTTPPVTTPPVSTPEFTFTTLLYFGLRGTAVTNLQTVLIGQGDLGSQYATGYFGALTQAAVQRFQCSKGIVCSGSPWVNGYGLVGVRTRAALNALSSITN